MDMGVAPNIARSTEWPGERRPPGSWPFDLRDTAIPIKLLDYLDLSDHPNRGELIMDGIRRILDRFFGGGGQDRTADLGVMNPTL